MNTNFGTLATTPERKMVLDLIEAAFSAIDTEKVMRSVISLNGTVLRVKDVTFDLSKYKTLHIIGFGKVVCEATATLNTILKGHIDGGIAIGTHLSTCESVDMYEGSHPMPSDKNVIVSKAIVDLSERLGEDDLVIVIVSGGGSALLCWPPEECAQSQRLYEAFLKTGGTISELNTVRKHLSSLKGGGLAKSLYPATVIGLVFSDIPGGAYSEVASGPTYKDTTTVDDARAILKKYNLGDFNLMDTPKDDMYFKKVTNIPLVSNTMALEAMATRAQELDLAPVILSDTLYDSPEIVAEKMLAAMSTETQAQNKKRKHVVLAAGEPTLQIPEKHGKGGRNQQLALTVLSKIKKGATFASVASDGRDNTDSAGAIVDSESLTKAQVKNLDITTYLADFNAYPFFEQIGDALLTGPTGANISDFMILLENNA